MAAVVQSNLAAVYDQAVRERIRRLTFLRAHPGEFAYLKRYYRTHIADWINDWGVTVDPRNAGTELPVVMPFLLDPRQREWIEFTFNNWRDRKYGLTEKSRDVGVSWLIVGFSLALCTLYDGAAIGWGSYKREKVDLRGDMGSLFEKARNYLDALPEEFRGGFEPEAHSFEKRIIIPDTGASIIGEIGDNIGRGGRTSVYFVDEAAHLDHDLEIDASLSKNTRVRQDASSVYGMNNTFAERAHRKGIRKFTFHWRENPRFTQKEYDEFLDTWGPVITAQELDINYQASLEGVLIPALWVNAAVDADVKLGLTITGERSAALDVADQGIDKNAVAIRHGVKLLHVESFTGKDSDIYATVERAFGICDQHAVNKLRYDADGVGAGVRGDARKVNEQRNPLMRIAVTAHRGSAQVLDPKGEMVQGRKNEDMFLNFKAQTMWALRIRFQNTFRAVNGKPYDPEAIIVISGEIPEKARLLIELSQPTHSQNPAGKLLIDKQPDGSMSPNLADAVAMAYAPGRRALKIDERMLDGDLDATDQ